MKKSRFSFGKNWLDYVKNFVDEDKINIATDSLLKYLEKTEYQDKTFIDVGCGSGIFSLSALRLGCKKVISFDVDPQSIEATKFVKEKFSYLFPKNSSWEIFVGDILDKKLINRLKNQGDIVYSWGVLHHTGNMFLAIENTCQLVKKDGHLILAIYNRAPSSDFWLKVKKMYNSSPMIIQKVMVYIVFFYLFIGRSLSFIKRKLFKQKTKLILTRERGMSIFYDVIDWLGGYPYEYATFKEVVEFVEPLGFQLIKAPTKLPLIKKKLLNRFTFSFTGNNEFVFQRIR